MLKIYNTLTQQKETFKPMREGKAGIYVCGVTVYDYCHIGHARTYTSADVIVRYLRFRGYEVNYVRNITDIDDKIIKRANENKEEYNNITSRFIQAMNEDFAALGLTPANEEPRATDYIPDMIKLIEQIIKNGHGYVAANGDVYFDVRSFPEYGCLSHHNIDELESGARVEVTEVKRDPLDFVLWKLAKPGEPKWDSPWGEGRPGWHIECSAMSMDLLGEQFDIHAGGRDLIFPHHENEIAQSQAATNKKFANVWMHGGFLQIDKEKMSKSLGNFITIRDALRDHSPEALRYLLLASHYRSPLVYTDDALAQAQKSLKRLYSALRALPDLPSMENSSFENKFIEAMDDDFNVPVALSVLFDLSHEIQRLRYENPSLAASYAALLKKLGCVLGILQQDPEKINFGEYKSLEELVSDSFSAEVYAAIDAREQARKNKDWKRADEIRKELSARGIELDDTPNGTFPKLKFPINFDDETPKQG